MLLFWDQHTILKISAFAFRLPEHSHDISFIATQTTTTQPVDVVFIMETITSDLETLVSNYRSCKTI